MGSWLIWKSLSLNTVELKLYSAKRKAYINFAQKRQVIWARIHLRWTERQWKRVLWSDESTFQLVFGKNRHQIICANDEKRYRKVQKSASMMVWGCISAHGMGDLHICEDTIDAEAYVEILERHMLLSRPPGTPCLFQQDNARPHSARVTTLCLTGLPAVQICLLLKMYCASWRGESDNGDHGLSSSPSLTPSMGTKNSTCKTATIDILSSKTITKCN